MHDPRLSDRSTQLARAAPWVAIGLLFTYRISSPIVDLDLYHQMALVREWLASGELSRVDLYAFTPTIAPFMHHEWGAGAIAYPLAAAFGGAGILVLRYALALGVAAIVVRAALRAGAAPTTTIVLAPIAIGLVEAGYSPVRAQAYSFLFAAITVYCLERDRAGAPRWLWLTVPVFVAWVNLHGGFVIGLVLLLVYAAERALQRAPFVHVLALVALLFVSVSVTPYGLEYYGHMLRSIVHDRSLISEWEPIWSSAGVSQGRLAFAASGLFIAYALAYGRPPKRDGLLLVASMAALGAKHKRMLPFYGVVWLVYCSAWLRGSALSTFTQRLPTHRPRSTALVSGAVAIAAAAVLLRSAPWPLRVPNEPLGGDASAAPYYPVGAVNFLRAARFEGNVLTPFGQGSYVLWKLYPRVKVSLDSRFEAAYPQPLVEELSRMYATGKGADAVLQRYRPDVVLVPRHSGLGAAGLTWPRVYQDAGFALYARPDIRLRPATDPISASDTFP